MEVQGYFLGPGCLWLALNLLVLILGLFAIGKVCNFYIISIQNPSYLLKSFFSYGKATYNRLKHSFFTIFYLTLLICAEILSGRADFIFNFTLIEPVYTIILYNKVLYILYYIFAVNCNIDKVYTYSSYVVVPPPLRRYAPLN